MTRPSFQTVIKKIRNITTYRVPPKHPPLYWAFYTAYLLKPQSLHMVGIISPIF